MNYQLQCLCGHLFLTSDQNLGRHVTCPDCNRVLVPVAAVAVGPSFAPTETGPVKAAKACPLCGETILAVARKCKHCGEFLPEDTQAVAARKAREREPDPAVFNLSVSQWDNFWKYLTCLCLLAGAGGAVYLRVPHREVIFPAAMMLVSLAAYFIYLNASSAVCRIGKRRIETEVGLFSKTLEVVDFQCLTEVFLHQSLIQKILGIGTLEIHSIDPEVPVMELYKIPKAKKVYAYLQEQLPRNRQGGE